MFTFSSDAVLDQRTVAPLGRRPAALPMLPFTSSGRLGSVALLVLGVIGCAGSGTPSSTAEGSLAPYSPEAAVLFDDGFAPAVFGFDAEGFIPNKDPKLRDRTRQADFVAVARVETVSRRGGVEHHGAYEITLAPQGAPLVGEAVRGPLVVTVPTTNPSYNWVDGAGAKWVGSQLLVFGRRYREATGPALHFRCEPDTPEVRAAVAHDAGLRMLR
jgi:hypothetical protein